MNTILSTTRNTLLILILTQLCYVSLPAQDFVWERTNPGCGGSFSAAKVGPTGHIIACSDLGGAYYTTDYGDNWSVYGANVGIPQTHFSSVGFNFENPDIFYIGTEDGIYRTVNKGIEFEEVLEGGYIEDIVVANSNSNIVYAARHPFWNSPDGKIYKSTDNGENWTNASTGLPNNLRILKLLVDPSNANRVFLLSGKGDFACTPAKVYISNNGGERWDYISSDFENVLDISLKANNPDKIYLTTLNADCSDEDYWPNTDGEFWISDDDGDNWAKQSNRTGKIWSKGDGSIILIDPRRTWETTSGTWKSTNEGEDWSKFGGVSNYETGYIEDLSWSYGTSDNGICKTIGTIQSELSDSEPELNDIAVWVHSRFVYISKDAGNSFQQVFTNDLGEGRWQSRGIDNVVMYDFEINEQNPDIMYAGYFDIGFWRSFDQGQSWQPSNPDAYTGGWQGTGGNALTILSDPEREEVVWTVMKGDFEDDAFLLKSEEFGELSSWAENDNDLPRSPYIYSLTLDRNSQADNRTLYVSSNGDIYKSTNDGQNWNLTLNNGGMRVLAVDFFNSNYVYAGGEKGFYRTTNGGESWEDTGLSSFEGNDVTGPFEEWNWEGVIDIYTDRETEGLLYVAVHGEDEGLYKSTDRGLNWELLLNDDHARCITANPNNNNQLFFGSSSAYKSGGLETGSNGILYSENQGEDWINITENSTYPFATTIDVTAETSNQKVFVGSPGTGFQYADLPESESENTALGDVNCDGEVDAVDAMFILRYVVGYLAGEEGCPLLNNNSINILNADVNSDGNVSAVDAMFVLQCIVDVPNIFCP